MEIRSYETHGRRLMVEFTCQRCRTTSFRPLEDCMKGIQCFQNLYDLVPPSGWYNGGFYHRMLCKNCKEKYDRFMRGEED